MEKISANNVTKSKHFCILPWTHIQLHQNGMAYPCCRVNQTYTYGSIKDFSFAKIWNSENAKFLRKTLLNDKFSSICIDCHKTELSGNKSLRQVANQDYQDVIDEMIDQTDSDGKLAQQKLLFIDLRFSNICNFKCRTCNPENSTSWTKDFKSLTGIDTSLKQLNLTEYNHSGWDEIETLLPFVRRIYFAGGEPMLQKDHYFLLEKLIARKQTDVILNYNTNLSTLKFLNWNILSLWKEFKLVDVAASFDGIGPQAKILRHGTNWPEIENNYKAIRMFLPNLLFSIYSTISAMNAFHITEGIERWIHLGMILRPEHFEINLLSYPKHLNINIFNKEERLRLEMHYKNFICRLPSLTTNDVAQKIESKLNQILQFFEAEVWNQEREQFRKYMLDLDFLRSENFKEIFPEHLTLLNEKSDIASDIMFSNSKN